MLTLTKKAKVNVLLRAALIHQHSTLTMVFPSVTIIVKRTECELEMGVSSPLTPYKR